MKCTTPASRSPSRANFKSPRRLRERFDESGEFFAAVTVAPRKVNQFTCSRDHGTTIGRSRNRDASSSTKLEQTFVAQNTQRPQDRIGIDIEHRREVPRRRKAFASRRFAIGNCFAKFRGHLIVQRNRIARV